MIIRPAAELDMSSAYNWYEDQMEGLGEDFLAAVDSKFRLIERMPEAPAVVEADVRRVLLQRFPYAIYYRYAKDEVIVIAVLHMKRSPAIWRRRR